MINIPIRIVTKAQWAIARPLMLKANKVITQIIKAGVASHAQQKKDIAMLKRSTKEISMRLINYGEIEVKKRLDVEITHARKVATWK
jgi:hypothetical protein